MGLSSTTLLYRWKKEQLKVNGPVATALDARVIQPKRMSDVAAVAEQISLDGGFYIGDVCQCLSIPRLTFYEHRREELTLNETRTKDITPIVLDIFWKHRKRYGTRRIVQELADNGLLIGRRRIANIMKAQGLHAIQPKSFTPKTTESRHRLGYSPNLLLENFSLKEINQLWVGDITYIPLAERTIGYLAMLMDRFSRRLIGWQIDTSMTEALVIHGLRSAIAIRQPNKRLILHTDRGPSPRCHQETGSRLLSEKLSVPQ